MNLKDYKIVQKKDASIGWYPICPKCKKTGVNGTYGVKGEGKTWLLGVCSDCGYKFRYEVDM
jgi:RNase P subunit RPR2